ncbi:MAG: ArsA family ATPase [Nocardioidaceae bacterium]
MLVTGKGGVGKTTVAGALGLAAARNGKRTIVCEVTRQQRLAPLFGREAEAHREIELGPDLNGISIDPDDAKAEWLRYQLRSGTLAGVLGQSRIFQLLTAAAPGLAELVTIGKVWELAQLERKDRRNAPYDLVVVDAPATGQGLALLRAPRTYADIARVGPIHRQAEMIDSFLRDDARTGMLVVALAEEMPVNETLELEGRLDEELAMSVDLVVVNALYPERFTAADARAIESLDSRGSEEARAVLRAALSEHRRARAQRSQLRRLRRGASAPVTTLPYLFREQLGAADLEQLSRDLEGEL